MAPESRDEVRQRIDSLYDQAENATGNFNATRAMALRTRSRGVPLAKKPARRSDPALDQIAQRWFDSARGRLGPTVPAALPADRLPDPVRELPAAPVRSPDLNGGGALTGGERTALEPAPSAPAPQALERGVGGTTAELPPPGAVSALPAAGAVAALPAGGAVAALPAGGAAAALPTGLAVGVSPAVTSTDEWGVPAGAESHPPMGYAPEPAGGPTAAPVGLEAPAAGPATPTTPTTHGGLAYLPGPPSLSGLPGVSGLSEFGEPEAVGGVPTGPALLAAPAPPHPRDQGRAPRPLPGTAGFGSFSPAAAKAAGRSRLATAGELLTRHTAPPTWSAQAVQAPAAPGPAPVADLPPATVDGTTGTGTFAYATDVPGTGTYATDPSFTGASATGASTITPSATGAYTITPSATGPYADALSAVGTYTGTASVTGAYATDPSATGTYAEAPSATGTYATGTYAAHPSVTDPFATGTRSVPYPATAGAALAPPAAVPADTPAPESPRALRAAKAIAFARAQIGKPCVWGATGPDSYDCSSLTQAAWRAAGVTLPRAAHEQAAAGTQVTTGGLEPGDLILFFDDDRHVGLHVGGGMMVHAPGPGSTIREESVYGAGEAAIRRIVRPA
ncbi:C40 family peptidase [Streptomyces echinatus]|uniref:C40 family peptidase n=1 Tax=Streptomyces echinatus TaxID=67293 RepID=UPI0037BB8E00